MLPGTRETRISKRNRELKAEYFPGALFDDMYDYTKLLLKKLPGNTVLPIGTNNMVMSYSK